MTASQMARQDVVLWLQELRWHGAELQRQVLQESLLQRQELPVQKLDSAGGQEHGRKDSGTPGLPETQ